MPRLDGAKADDNAFTPCCVIAQLEDAGLNIMASIADVHRHVFNLFSPVIGKDVLLGNISRLPCDEEFVFARFIFLCKLNFSTFSINDFNPFFCAVHTSTSRSAL